MKKNFAEFNELVRDALNKLYDSPQLSEHPLVSLITEPDLPAMHRTRQTRSFLLAGIEALRPGASVPAQSPDWRAYNILEKRYVDGLTTAEIIADLAISRAQLFRDQARAIDLVVQLLWENLKDQSNLATRSVKNDNQISLTPQLEALDLLVLIRELVPIITSITEKEAVSYEAILPDMSIPITIDRVIFRQIILLIVNELLTTKPSLIELIVENDGSEAVIRLGAGKAQKPVNHDLLQSARELARHLNAGIDFLQSPQQIQFKISLQCQTHQSTLLVVDDNQEIAGLFRRYLSGYDWVIIAASDVLSATQQLVNLQPTAIILDVMMPGSDGWDLLLKLKSASDTAAIPVFVCSAVYNKDTAIALGADGYISKPVTQEIILEILKPLLNS